jgi:hypothetical protein
MAADDALINSSADDARRRLELIRRALIREIESLLRRLDNSNGELIGTRGALANARQIKSQVLSLMREMGYPVVISLAEQKVEDAAQNALRASMPPRSMDPMAPGIDASFEAEAKASIERSVRGVLDEVAGLFADAEQEMRVAIDRGLSTAAPLEDVIDDVARALDTSFAKASAAVDAAIRGASTKATLEVADAASEATGVEMVFELDGPIDSKTRPWCRQNVGRVFTRAALARLDNGTAFPAEIFRGGIACRHRWVTRTRAEVEAEGTRINT